MNFLFRTVFLCLFIGLYTCETVAQIKQEKQKVRFDKDTNYVVSFPNVLNARTYLSRKFTNLRLSKRNGRSPLRYNPNTTLNFGVGATYGGFTLNLGYGFSLLNRDKGQGETQYLDLQSHLYGRKYVVDIFGQFYQGMHLQNTSKFSPDIPGEFYQRPDLKIRALGFNGRKIMNDEQFSYSAAFVQNRLQKKSAGSLLIGVKALVVFYEADSNLIPFFVDETQYGNTISNLVKSRSTQAGPTVGYAYTLIYKKHFFLTGSFNLGFSFGPVKNIDEDGNELKEWQINPTASAKFAAGYNCKEWYLGFTYLQDETTIRSIDGEALNSVGVGNLRFNYVYRIKVKGK